jgi:hypothetical protein
MRYFVDAAAGMSGQSSRIAACSLAAARDAFLITTEEEAEDMAKTVSVVVTDDLDGSPGAETLAFSWDGNVYEIDLAAPNAARLRQALQPFVVAARAIPRSRPARSGQVLRPKVDRAAVRAWAAKQGLQVSDRGRISGEIMSQYEAAR